MNLFVRKRGLLVLLDKYLVKIIVAFNYASQQVAESTSCSDGIFSFSED